MTDRWLDAGADTTRLPSPAGIRLAARAHAYAHALDKTAAKIPAAEARTRDHAPGQPGAASYDGVMVSGSRSQSWCFHHGINVAHDDHQMSERCDIESVSVNDPAGEAATEGRTGHDFERVIRAALNKIESAIGDLARLVDGATVTAREADPLERAKVERGNTRPDPGCEWCAKVPGPSGTKAWWNPVGAGLEHFTAGGSLSEAAVCKACYEFYRTRGHAPAKLDLLHKRDHGTWPKTHEGAKT